VTGPDSVLARIVERRRADIAAQYGGLALEDIECTEGARPVRDFVASITAGHTVAVIAEVKKASPSAGAIAPHVDPASLARRYERGGAAAISVLTEPVWFGGTFQDLSDVAVATRLPVLCKDFVVEEVQPHIACTRGADAILLMVSVLGDDLGPYLCLTRSLGMEALVEVVSPEELRLALELGATLIGVNTRDLHTLEVDPERAYGVVRAAKAAGATVVLASGVKSRADVEAAAKAGADAVLVGEALMSSASPEEAVGELLGVPRRRTSLASVG